MQLNPRENFTIARQTGDPADTSTKYVQAVIRNAKTDVLIDTVNLTDRGSNRFTRTWQVPADPSGQGFYIIITTTVYTDSGYTQFAAYNQESATYLVQQRANPAVDKGSIAALLGGTGDGADVDYKRIRKIFEDVLDKRSWNKEDAPVLASMVAAKLMPKLDAIEGKEIEFPSLKNDFKAISDELGIVLKVTTDKIKGIEIPPVDLSGIVVALGNLKELIAGIEKIVSAPRPEQPNIEAAVARIENISEEISKSVRDAKGVFVPTTPKPQDRWAVNRFGQVRRVISKK